MKNDIMEALDAMKKLSPLLLAGAGESIEAFILCTLLSKCCVYVLCMLLLLLCLAYAVFAQVPCGITGYLFTYYNSKVGKEREAQIDRVNEQVKDLYGPLLSCVTASKSAFDAMIGQHSPDGTKAGFVKAMRDNSNSSEAQAYR